MIISRTKHCKFLSEELEVQVGSFKRKMNADALFKLEEDNELFIAQLVAFKNSEMILRFATKRGLPRVNEHLHCFLVPKHLRNYKEWKGLSLGSLYKERITATEVSCKWQQLDSNNEFSIAGFHGMSLEFIADLQDAVGVLLFLGPTVPPTEYLSALHKICLNNNSAGVSRTLDYDFQPHIWEVKALGGPTITEQAIEHLKEKNSTEMVICQGPPGTGKTFLIAEICAALCEQGASVLVTALTNKALMELAEKPALQKMLKNKRVFKTNLTSEESKRLPNLEPTSEIIPLSGSLILSTFFKSCTAAAEYKTTNQFDYVIVDEASQAFLSTIAATQILSNKVLLVGDTNQLPPIVELGDDHVNHNAYRPLINGLETLSSNSTAETYQLVDTYRLTERAAAYTGLFYKAGLFSKSDKSVRLYYPGLQQEYSQLFHYQGGPTLIKTAMPANDFAPKIILDFIAELIKQLLKDSDKLQIAVLAHSVKTVKAIQQKMLREVGSKKNLLVETVSRVQGLTTDITIYFVPNTRTYYSLEKRHFNVATSRSKRHTLIIADEKILAMPNLDLAVQNYLQKLNNEFSFKL